MVKAGITVGKKGTKAGTPGGSNAIDTSALGLREKYSRNINTLIPDIITTNKSEGSGTKAPDPVLSRDQREPERGIPEQPVSPTDNLSEREREIRRLEEREDSAIQRMVADAMKAGISPASLFNTGSVHGASSKTVAPEDEESFDIMRLIGLMLFMGRRRF